MNVCQSCAKPGTERDPLIFVQGQGEYHRSCAQRDGFIRSSLGAEAAPADTVPHQPPARGEQYEYKVIEVREKLLGGRMSGQALERLLNQYAAEGWRLKAMTAVEVKGRVGFGGVEGVLVTFERQRTGAPARWRR